MEHDIEYTVLPSGDIGFEYLPYKASDLRLSVLMGTSGLLSAGVFKITQMMASNYLLFLLVVPSVILVYALWDSLSLRKNKTVEQEAVRSILQRDDIVNKIKATYGQGVEVSDIKYSLQQVSIKGENKRLVYVSLSNKNIITFHIIRRKHGNDGKWRLTFKNESSICTDSWVQSSMLSFKDRYNKMVDKEDPRLGLSIYIIIWALLSGSIGSIIYYFPHQFNCVVWSYVIAAYILGLISRNVVFSERVLNIILFPSRLISLTMNLSVPFFIMVFGILIIIVIGGIASTLLYLLTEYLINGGITFDQNLAIFIGLACTSIIAVHCNKLVLWFFKNTGILTFTESNSLEMPLLGLAQYIFTKQNINYLIYLAYFLFLLVSYPKSLLMNQTNASVIDLGVDMAVTKALLLHIAATNMVAKYSEVELKAVNIYQYFRTIMGVKD